MPVSQADSGHETLHSDDDSPPPPVIIGKPPPTIMVQERASSEVLYSSISNGSLGLASSNYARSRRSLAEPPVTAGGAVPIYEDIDQFHQQPPMIAPVGGVPNLKGKVIRPIAFRPTPGSTTPTTPHSVLHGRPDPRLSPAHAAFPPTTSATPNSTSYRAGPQNEGFAPGHPLIKDGRRHYGSSQELHVQPPPSSTLSKFNSLDRRALSKRHNGMKLVTPQSGPLGQEQNTINRNGFSTTIGANNEKKEPERRHSSYDPSSRSGSLSNSRSSSIYANVKPSSDRLSAMNQNGLPDPATGIYSAGGSMYSSQESLHRSSSSTGTVRITTGSRAGAGTPQFQNLSGVVRPSAVRAANNNNGTSFSFLRSTSGSSLHQLHSLNLSSSAGSSSDTNQTPSPSDSAVGDLESMLKEKDSEINYLRETMEQNEQVIFKVYEEKEKMWERELRKIKGLYDNRLRASQQKSAKMEQALTNQTYQLQCELRKLEREMDELRRDFDSRTKENEKLKQELAAIRKPSDKSSLNGDTSLSPTADSSAEVISGLRIQVKDLRTEVERKDEEIRDLQMSKKSLQTEVALLKAPREDDNSFEDSDSDYTSLREHKAQKQIIIARDREIERLQEKLEAAEAATSDLKSEASKYKVTFETEKANWLDEKEKVIRYQKQLQLNYVQMYKRNKTLEGEVERLNKAVTEAEQKKASEKPTSRYKAFFGGGRH